MILKLIIQSWRRSPRSKILAVLTVFLAASLLSALLAVSLDIGDKMAREMKSYGANIIVEPAEQAVLPSLFGEGEENPLEGQGTLKTSDLANIMDIFWRNNIVGFAPMLEGRVMLGEQVIPVAGTFFEHHFPVSDEPDYHTGQKIISPYWHVEGAWPDDEQVDLLQEAPIQALVGAGLAAKQGWGVGSEVSIDGYTVVISGVLSSGGEEDSALIVPLALAQEWLGLQGKIHHVKVSALTVPENELSRKALQDPEALDSESYDVWYCTAYVSAIAHQLEEAIPGSVVRPIWQVAASEGVVIEKLQWLLIVVTLAALVATAMGIASLMTSTLMERAKEIGLMKALGAHNWQVALLFYAEACISAVIGALLGCFAGWGLGYLIGWQLFEAPLRFTWIVVPCVILISIAIALVGTWFPVRRITQLYPIEVLYGRK